MPFQSLGENRRMDLKVVYVGGSRLTSVFYKAFGPSCASRLGALLDDVDVLHSTLHQFVCSKTPLRSASVGALHALNWRSVLVREVLSINGTTSKSC